MSESSKTWIPLKRELDKVGWTYDRIENNVGIPDLVVYVPPINRDIWVELKYSPGPNIKGIVEIGLRKEQFIWMRNAYNHGRSVILLARIGDMWYIWNDAESWEMAKRPQNFEEMTSISKIGTSNVEYLTTV